MIAYLEGEILRKFKTSFIVKTNGVGYLIYATTDTISNISEHGEFYIYSNIKEDAFELYGFESLEDKEFFEKLISVNKVGPKTALNILELGVQKVQSAINNADINFLKKASGLGKKGAERIVLELKGKLAFVEDIEIGIPEDVFVALSNLGYKRKQVEIVLAQNSQHNQSVESIIKFFLQNV